MASVLNDCIAKHGWSERLEVAAAGLGRGAGRPDDRELALIPAGRADLACPDVEAEPGVIDAAECLVVGSGAEAELFCQWPGTEGKQVLAFCDFAGDDATSIEDPSADLARFCDDVAEVAPSLLRSLVAQQ